MRPRIPLAAALAAALAAPACASAPPPAEPGPECASPRLHHLLDLQDARAPLPELESFLRDPDPEVRARAALAVAGKAGVEGEMATAAALLRLAARDPESRVREAAAFAMGLTDDPDLAGDALLATRRADATPSERAAAASAAVRLGGKRLWEEEAFGALFRDADPVVRRAAYRALPAAMRGWKEKPPLDGEFARSLLPVGKGDIANREEDPVVAASAFLFLRGLLPPPDGPAPSMAPLEPIRAHIASEDADVRAAAGRLRAALMGASPDARPEPDARVRASILMGLGREGPGERQAALVDALRGDPDFGVRATAALVLGVRGTGGAAALEAAAAEDPSRLVRVEALNALHLVLPEGPSAALAAAVASDDPFLRAAAAGKRSSLEDLARLAKDPEIRVRESAVSAAGERGREGFAICLEALDDADPVVAAIAAGGLGGMGPQDPDPRSKEPPPTPMTAEETAAAVAVLERALDAHPGPTVAPDDWADLRAAAVEALGKLKAPSAAARARDLLGDPDPSVRDMAAKVVEEIEKKKPEMPLPARLLPFPDRADLLVSDEGAPRVRFETDRGTFVVRTLPSAAPVHVARFLARVRSGGYDGTVFHRIVPAFVVQGGDPRGDGSGSGGATTRAEFSPVPFRRGTLGVPRSSSPDSGGCQLFFCHGETPHLDQRYTVMGEIVEGVEVIDRIDLGDRILRATAE